MQNSLSIGKKETLLGTIERISYRNEASCFSVLKVSVKGKSDLIVIIGSLPDLSVGEEVRFIGNWKTCRLRGRQFEAESAVSFKPTNLDGIEKYLGSGALPGVGPSMAKKMINEFGKQIFDIIEKNPDSLKKISGFGSKKIKKLCDHWKQHSKAKEVMIFLCERGVSPSQASKIYREYGSETIESITKDPYAVSQSIRGFGFAIADKLAYKLGIDLDSSSRISAAVEHTLNEVKKNGHCGLEEKKLISDTFVLLKYPDSEVEEKNALISDTIEKGIAEKRLQSLEMGERRFIFLRKLLDCEIEIARKIALISGIPPKITFSQKDHDNIVQQVADSLNISLAKEQIAAAKAAIKNKILIITGGPGTGKTTVIKLITKIFENKKAIVKLCAPTGKAAKRISESVEAEAQTIHRLLGIGQHNTEDGMKNKISCDLLIADEASMIDIVMMQNITFALQGSSHLILVGDINQLPSVGPGQVLKDLIDSKLIACVVLKTVFRQKRGSLIAEMASAINRGIIPSPTEKGIKSEFYFIETEDDDLKIKDIAVRSVTERVPKAFGIDAKEIQVLCPSRRGICGTISLNSALQMVLNKTAEEYVEYDGCRYAEQDKVMQISNNYDKNVFNGDSGHITSICKDTETVCVDFENHIVTYTFDELDQISLAYACTIHKSQGSEYRAAVIILPTSAYSMLKKKLLYTAITRCKDLVILIGSKKAVRMAVHSDPDEDRVSSLKIQLLKIFESISVSTL